MLSFKWEWLLMRSLPAQCLMTIKGRARLASSARKLFYFSSSTKASQRRVSSAHERKTTKDEKTFFPFLLERKGIRFVWQKQALRIALTSRDEGERIFRSAVGFFNLRSVNELKWQIIESRRMLTCYVSELNHFGSKHRECFYEFSEGRNRF